MKPKPIIIPHKKRETFFLKIGRTTARGCLLWAGGVTGNGYGAFSVGKKVQYASHRVAWFLKTGRDPGVLNVLHECDNPVCVNPEHLFLGVHSDNMKDRAKKGRHNMQNGDVHWSRRCNHLVPKGEESTSSKVTEKQVAEIRERGDAGEGATSIARDFPIGRQQVSRIISRLRWSHL